MLHLKIGRKAREESYVPCQRINLSRLEDNQYQDGEGGRRPCLESKRRSPILHIVTTTLNHFASSNTSKNNESYKEENQLRRIITKRSQAWPTMTDNAKARSVDVTLFFNTFLLFLSSSWFQLLLSLSCSRGRIPSHVCVWAMNNIYSIQRYTIILSFRTTNVEQEECFVHKVLCFSLSTKKLCCCSPPIADLWCCLSPTKQKVDLTHLCSSFKLVIEHFQYVFADPKVASDRSSLAWIFRWIWNFTWVLHNFLIDEENIFLVVLQVCITKTVIDFVFIHRLFKMNTLKVPYTKYERCNFLWKITHY